MAEKIRAKRARLAAFIVTIISSVRSFYPDNHAGLANSGRGDNWESASTEPWSSSPFPNLIFVFFSSTLSSDQVPPQNLPKGQNQQIIAKLSKRWNLPGPSLFSQEKKSLSTVLPENIRYDYIHWNNWNEKSIIWISFKVVLTDSIPFEQPPHILHTRKWLTKKTCTISSFVYNVIIWIWYDLSKKLQNR